jgi:hypothetical protein
MRIEFVGGISTEPIHTIEVTLFNITERIMQLRAENPNTTFFDAVQAVAKELGRPLTQAEEAAAQDKWIRTRDA